MTDLFSDDHLFGMVPGLTPDRLLAFLDAHLVIPVVGAQTVADLRFTPTDVARLQFLCELTDDLGLEEPSLIVVIGLVDKLHAARSDLHLLARAIEAESADVRTRLGMVLTRSLA